jgi:hypothetical protein
MTKKRKSVFRFLWEGYAYLQALLDDTLLLIFKKLEEKWDEEISPEDEKKIHKKLMKIVWWMLWDAWAGFYEKYAELKQWDNLAEDIAYNKIPEIKAKATILQAKMKVLWIEKGNLESLKKLKDKRDLNFYKKLYKTIKKDTKINKK